MVPDDPVTREQLASIFYRYAQVKGYDTTQSGMAAGSDLLDLKGTVTRAETAEMLHQFVEKQGLKPVAASTARQNGGNRRAKTIYMANYPVEGET